MFSLFLPRHVHTDTQRQSKQSQSARAQTTAAAQQLQWLSTRALTNTNATLNLKEMGQAHGCKVSREGGEPCGRPRADLISKTMEQTTHNTLMFQTARAEPNNPQRQTKALEMRGCARLEFSKASNGQRSAQLGLQRGLKFHVNKFPENVHGNFEYLESYKSGKRIKTDMKF